MTISIAFEYLCTEIKSQHWKRIGCILGIKVSILNKIGHNNQNDKDCHDKLCKILLETDSKSLKTCLSHASEIIKVTDLLQNIYKSERNKQIKEIWGSYLPQECPKVSPVCYKQKQISEEQNEAIASIIHRGGLTTHSMQLLNKYVSCFDIDMCFNDIFDSEENPVEKIILIEGAPGIGKTVLSRQIAFEWANEQILRNNPFLFLMHLHESKIPKIKSLNEFVAYAISSNPESSNLVELTVKYLNKTLGWGCTIVLDGYDEITQEIKKNSVVAKIMNRKMLPYCNLVITSHPTTSIDLHGHVDHRIEILGFTERKREEYITKHLQKVEEVERLQDYLNKNPLIDGLCYIPLNITMLLRIFKEQYELPKTQTYIITQFVYITISNFLSKLLKMDITMNSCDDLKEPYKQQFTILCKLAFNLLTNEKVVFNDIDNILKCDPNETSRNWKTMGLLKEVNYYKSQNNELKTSYSFLHLSMQECLAAHYIVSSKQTEDMFLKNHFWDLRYFNTGVMYVGLTGGKSPAFKEFLTRRLGILNKLLGSDMATVHDKVVKLHLLSCLYEADNAELCESLQISKISGKDTIDLSNHVLQHKDIHNLSFFLAKSTIRIWNKLDLSNCFTTEEYLLYFLSVISEKEITNVTINIIDLSGNNVIQSVNAIIHLINYFNVKKLVVADSTAENVAFKESLISSITKVNEKVVISSSKNISHFFINGSPNYDLNQYFPSQLEPILYVWNANDFTLIAKLLSKFNVINVYEQGLPNKDVVTAVSKLDKIISTEKNKTITYLLHSADMMYAYGAEFYQIAQNFKNRCFTEYGCATLRCCYVENKQFNKTFSNMHFSKLEVSQFSLNILEILECCKINHLIVSDDSISDEETCAYILNEIITKEYKTLNFINGVPLMLSINDANNLFFVNCVFSDSTVHSCNPKFVNSKLCFSGITLTEENVHLFSIYCKSNILQFNLFEMNVKNEILDNVLMEIKLLESKKYVLTSNTKLVAFKANQQQIIKAITTNQTIVILQLINCEIHLAKSNPLGRILSNNSDHWETIDLSQCNIEDEGCLILYECLTASKNVGHIKVLNLSSNNLTADSVIIILKIFQYCIIEVLILSKNDIPGGTFDKTLQTHLLTQNHFMNFSQKISLIVHEGSSTDNLYEMCSVYAFEASNMRHFKSHIYKNNTQYSLYQVCIDQNRYKCNMVFSILPRSFRIKVAVFEESDMNHIIMTIVTELNKYLYCKYNQFSLIDFSRIEITQESCKVLCCSLFNDQTSLKFIETLNFSSCKFSLNCVPTIIEALQYCVIEYLVLPCTNILNVISKKIFQASYTEKRILNFIKKTPLTLMTNPITYNEEENCTNDTVVETFAANCEVTEELFEALFKVLKGNYYNTSLHNLILLNCLIQNNSTLTSILSVAPIIRICIIDVTLSSDSFLTCVKHLENYGNRIQCVSAFGTKIMAYKVELYQIVRVLITQLFTCDISITHCSLSKGDLQTIASYLISKKNTLKNVKISECKIQDNDFYDFCESLSSMLYDFSVSFHLETVDISHNYLTSSCVHAILKFLQCCVIKTLIISNNFINNTILSDAIYQLACSEGDKIKNINSGIPLVIINANTMQFDDTFSIATRHYVVIFIMNCEVDESINELMLEYSGHIKKVYIVNSIEATSNITMKLKMLQDSLPDITEVVYYENHLKDEVAQKAAMHLTKEAKINTNFILVSRTKLFAYGSSYHHIAPLLDSNPLITTLQLTNFNMQFPNEGEFIRALTETSRNWEMIDMSCCNIRDSGCLKLQECFISSKSTIQNLNLMYNNLSSASAAPISNMILKCDVKKVNVSHNKVQESELNNALKCLKCLKQNSTSFLYVEIIADNSPMIIISDEIPKTLPTYHKVQLSIMHCHQPECIEYILSSFCKIKVSQLMIQSSGLTLEQTKSIIEALPFTDLHIEGSHVHYHSTFTDYSLQYFTKIFTNDKTVPPFSSLVLINMRSNKICTYNINTINSVEYFLTHFIEMSSMVIAIKLSNCYITHEIAHKLTSAMKKITDLKLFELSNSYVQDLDLKLITEPLKSSRSLITFIIKSINCFNDDTAENIASIIASNNNIRHLEISNNNLKKNMIINIAKSMKDLKLLRQVNLHNNIVTHEVLTVALRERYLLEKLNLSHCKLQEADFLKICSTLQSMKSMKLTSINLSYNNVTNAAARSLSSLLCNQSIAHVEMANCNLQEEGMASIINALKHKSLKHLNFSGNRITDLLAAEISAGILNNPDITSLDLSNCSLEDFGVVEILTSLKQYSSHLRSLKIGPFISNKETAGSFKDVLSRNRNIENLSLQHCKCEGVFDMLSRKTVSTLQYLDFTSSIMSLKNLISIVGNNTNIKHLNISNCDVHGKTDITENNFPGLFLEYLNIGNTNITQPFAEFIISLICNSSYKLQHLDINSCKIQESELICVTDSLTVHHNLIHLNYSNNIVINYQIANSLVKVIKNNIHLEYLDISSCHFSDQTFLLIMSALKQVKLLKFLNISSNCLSFNPVSTSTEHQTTASVTTISTSANEIKEIINCNHFLECLDISNCKLSDSQMATVSTALINLSTLKCFNIADSEIVTDDTAINLASAITNNLSLKSINLSNCRLQENGIIIIADALAKLASLLSIDLSYNNITGNSAKSVADAIKANPLFEQLNLSYCFKSSAHLKPTSDGRGINDVLMSLTTLKCLTYLNLRSCYITDEASKLLSVIIVNNKYLSHLDLANCKLHDNYLISITKELQPTLKYLSLSSNIVTNKAAHEMSSAVRNNFSLQHLSLSDCELDEKGLIDIAEALCSISSIKHLDLSYNAISDKAAETLSYGIASNKALEFLNLSFCTWQDTGFVRIREVMNQLPMVKVNMQTL